jgi:hypothetical protein
MSDYGSTPPPPPPPPGSGGGGGGYDAPPPGSGGGGYGAPPPPMGGPAGSPPPNNLVLAIISLLCCWPVGIPAVIFAAQVNGKWASGDQAGAVEASAKARKFAIIALVLGIVSTVIYGAVILAGGLATTDTGTGM